MSELSSNIKWIMASFFVEPSKTVIIWKDISIMLVEDGRIIQSSVVFACMETGSCNFWSKIIVYSYYMTFLQMFKCFLSTLYISTRIIAVSCTIQCP